MSGIKAVVGALIFTTSVGMSAARAESCTSLDDLRWLLGHWTATDGGKRMTERWQRVSAQTFEGIGSSQGADADTDLELLRLAEMSGEIFYLAKVSHNELPVAFKLTDCSGSAAVFENPAHDFPRRLEYRLMAAGRLQVLVSGAGGKRFTLDFRRESS
ncbi:DUF6265 family protein [Microbulbifer magnicolonia]|uniref:DUF6265 family protein n=1 Tax=Microbulbifer magnicolonia TaxID=3109744 RepID=UPI002B403C55|nr:DUF6265 family protein [Microbulbifer sp. GG15]